MKILPASLLPFLLLMASDGRSQTVHCGTARWIQDHGKIGGIPKAGNALITSVVSRPSRTFETDHFLIRYALRGYNRVKMVPGDEALIKTTDSLYATVNPGVTGNRADSSVYARLDALNAPAPVYIDTLAGYFEQAIDVYVNKLKMRTPTIQIPSYYFQAPPAPGGKYSVDVVDIGTAAPDYYGEEIYALTFPPSKGGMAIENDFLFNEKLLGDGTVSGDSIKSVLEGKVLHNYAQEWDKGLKVTIFHEFYHAEQFTYTPNTESFHTWYETGATGMEERNAPEVNDYLQYIPSLFQDLPNMSMFDYHDRLSQYGNAIFHVFLTHELGETFDVKVWETLAANGNQLPDALAKTFASYGRTSKDLFARYAAQLALSGTDLKDPLVPFSPDIPLWPKLPYDSLDLKPLTPFVSGFLPQLSLRAIKVTNAHNSGKALILSDTSFIPSIVHLGSDSSKVDFPVATHTSLDFPSGADDFVMLSNGSLLEKTTAVIKEESSKVDTAVIAYPNPLARKAGTFFFTRLTRPSTVEIYGESGIKIKQLAFTSDNPLWTWDLSDADGKAVAPGVYYFRADGGKLRALYIN